ncbi:MAG: C-terminal target protein [Bacteroidota bacterium]|nr:C-terminal target protein [Bacteroidota bacterium]
MKKILLPILISLFFFPMGGFGQRLINEVCTGSVNDDVIYSTHENNDSTTTMIVQTKMTLGFYFYTYSIIKLDKFKNIILNKTLDSSYTPAALEPLFDNDGKFLLRAGQGEPIRAFKYDKDGNYLWEADSLQNMMESYFWETNISQKSNTGYFFYTGNSFKEKQIISVSATGKFLWKKDFSMDNILPESIANKFIISLIALPNNNALLAATASKPGLFPFPDDTSRTFIYLLDSLGNTIATDTTNTISFSPYQIQNINDYTSSHYIVAFRNPMSPIQRIFIDPNNLSVISGDTLPQNAFNELLATTYNNRFDDTSRIYVFPFLVQDSLIYCKDIHFHLLWSYKLQHANPNVQYRSDFLLLSNTKIFVDHSLIDNGTKRWDSPLETRDTIFYKGKSWYWSATNVKLDYNGADISYIIKYVDANGGFSTDVHEISLVQIIDINTGAIKERMIIEPKTGYMTYISHYNRGHVFIASPSSICGFGETDSYFGYYSSDYNTVIGVAFIDYNNNHILDGVEPTYPWGFAYTQSAADSQAMHFFSNGIFIFYADTGHYTTHISLYNNYFTISPPSYISTHSTYGNADTLFFALKPIPGKNDLEIKLINNWRTRMGQENNYTISLTNKGAFGGSGKVKLLLDPRLLNPTETPSQSLMNGDTIIWNINNLPPGQTLSAAIHFTGATPPTLNAGDTLFSQAWITSDSADVVPADNYTTLSEPVLASFDPNEKTILSGSTLTPQQVANGDYVSFIIHFQNKGNDTAFRVIVLDTLSSNVDINSLQVIGSSAPYTLEIFQDHILKFTFDNIKLDFDTTNMNSTGYIAYKVKAKSNLSAGSTIDNTADILFDYNASVKTNTVQTRILILTPVAQIKSTKENLSIYPNPNNGLFTVKFEDHHAGNIQLQLIDLTGKIILLESKQHRDISEFTIDASTLSKGMYWLKIFDGINTVSKAVVVQ